MNISVVQLLMKFGVKVKSASFSICMIKYQLTLEGQYVPVSSSLQSPPYLVQGLP